MNKKQKYQFGSISLFNIKNKNETRVVWLMSKVLKEFPDYKPVKIDIQDIYALTLNSLPPRYVQEESLVFKEPITDDMIKAKLREAIKRVREHPHDGNNQNIVFATQVSEFGN